MAQSSSKSNRKRTRKPLATEKVVDKNIYMECFMDESASDVVFIVNGQRVPAMKTILCFKSPVFRAMFSGNLKESNDKEVVIEDTTYEAFKALIRFIYSDLLVLSAEEDLDSIKELVKLADRYQVYPLITRIGENLKDMISLENLELISGIAFDYNIEELIEKIKEFIEINFNVIINKDMKEIKKINVSTHNCLFEVLAEHYKHYKKSNPGLQTD